MTTFLPGTFKDKTRPTRWTPEVKVAIVKSILPKVLEWLEDSSLENEKIIEELAKTIDTDGYAWASKLARLYYWSPNSELVDILDGADFYSTFQEAQETWVIDNNLTPKFSTGCSVKVVYKALVLDGEILERRKDGTYLVHLPSLDHVKEGIGTRGLFFTWEEVEAKNGLSTG